MGYLLLLLATLSWSFVGILVKSTTGFVDSTTIAFARFAFGIVFLGGLLLLKDRALKLRFNMKWIWIGAAGKCCNYLFENIALSIGYSYGNILIGPIQTVILLVLSAFWFKEHVSVRGWIAAALCIGGVLLISWNGLSLSELLQGGMVTTLLYGLAALGTAFHVLSQKVLIKEMDAGNMNFSVFLVCTVLLALPLPWTFSWSGEFSVYGLLALVLLGVITGLGFYWFSLALKLVSFPIAVIVSNSWVLFSILWAYLFYHDPITIYVIGGGGFFVAGLVLLNLPLRSAVERQISRKMAGPSGGADVR